MIQVNLNDRKKSVFDYMNSAFDYAKVGYEGIKKGYGYTFGRMNTFLNERRSNARKFLQEQMEKGVFDQLGPKPTWEEFKNFALKQAKTNPEWRAATNRFNIHGTKQFWAGNFTSVGREVFRDTFHTASYAMVAHPLYAGQMLFKSSLTPEAVKDMNIVSQKLLKMTGYDLAKGGELTAGQRLLTSIPNLLLGKSLVATGINAFVIGSMTSEAIKSGKYDLENALMMSTLKTVIDASSFMAGWSAVSTAALVAEGGILATYALPLVGALAVGALANETLVKPIENYFELRSNLGEKYRRMQQRGFNMGIVDTRMAATMRQQSLQAIQKSYMSARQFVLGNEATLLERSL